MVMTNSGVFFIWLNKVDFIRRFEQIILKEEKKNSFKSCLNKYTEQFDGGSFVNCGLENQTDPSVN